MPAGRDDDRDRDRRKQLLEDALLFDVPLLDGEAVADLVDGVRGAIDGVTPDPEGIEAALDGATLPEVGDLEATARTLPGSAGVVDPDAVVDLGSDVAEVAVETGGEAGTVLVEAGGETVRITVEASAAGAEVAGEVAAEAVVAALEGV